MTVGNKVKEARADSGLTQEQAAEHLGVSRQTISNWETGKSLPDIVSVIIMSELYQLSLDELLKGDHDMMKKIEKDTQVANSTKKMIRYAWVSVMIGIILLILGQLFAGNPLIDFLKGAIPWILLGLGLLFAILYLNKHDEK